MGFFLRLIPGLGNKGLNSDDASKATTEPIAAREFDLTKFATGITLAIPLVMAAVLKALDEAGITVDSTIVVGALAVVAASVLGLTLVQAVDIASRAYLTKGGSAATAAAQSDGNKAATDGARVRNVAAVANSLSVGTQEEDFPRPVLAVTWDEAQAKTLFLIPTGERTNRSVSSNQVDYRSVFEGEPRWVSAEELTGSYVA